MSTTKTQIVINHTPAQKNFFEWQLNGVYMHIQELPHYNVNYKTLVFDDLDNSSKECDLIVKDLESFKIEVIELSNFNN